MQGRWPSAATVLVLVVASAAWAEPANPPHASPPPSAEAKAEARDRFDRGLRLFEQGDNASALAEFKRANDIMPNPLVLYNMGLVCAAMNRPVESVDALAAFLAQAGSGQREQRRHAEEVRQEQSGRIARLAVKTEVPATVEIDGVEVGHAPFAEPLRIASGAHVVGAQAPGYLPTRKEVTVAGQVTVIVVLNLLPAETRMAQLVVTSAPLGAEVWVNGDRVGTTPLPASVAVAPGSARVELRRNGYLRAERTVTLGDGARGDLAFALDEDPNAPSSSKGMLRLTASEPDVEVIVDGVPRKSAGAGVPLPEGPHELKVARPGFEPYQRIISVTAGGETPLALTLTPTPETRTRYEDSVRLHRVIGWTVLGAGAALTIAGGIYGVTKQPDVTDSRKYLNGILASEKDPKNLCYALGADYQARGCGPIKQDAQSRVDSAVLRRNLGFVGAGVGVLAVGVGTYVLLANGDADRYRKTTGVSISGGVLWTDGEHAGVELAGRF